MKKKILAIVVLLSLALMAAFPAFAQTETKYIIDLQHIVDESKLAELNATAADISATYGVNVMFVVTGDAGENGISDFIDGVYTSTFGSADGVIFGHDTTEAKWAYRTYGTKLSVLSDEDYSTIWDAYNEADTYSGGLRDYLAAVEEVFGAKLPSRSPLQTDDPGGIVIGATAEPQNERGALVVDMADLLTEEQENALRVRLAQISDQHSCDVVVVTANDIGGKSPMDFADDYFDYNGYRENGILLLVSMADRDWWVSTTGTGIRAVTDDALEKIEDDAVSQLSSGNYYKAFKTYADLCDEFLTDAENGEPYTKPKQPLLSMGISGVIAAAVGLITGGIGTGSMKSKLKSVHQKSNASDYMKKDSLNIMYANETFLYSNVSKTAIETDSRSGGGGGTHISSSGTSHGGGGGKF